MATIDDARAHVLQAKLADVQLGQASVFFGVGSRVPSVHLVVSHLQLWNAILVRLTQLIVTIDFVFLRKNTYYNVRAARINIHASNSWLFVTNFHFARFHLRFAKQIQIVLWRQSNQNRLFHFGERLTAAWVLYLLCHSGVVARCKFATLSVHDESFVLLLLFTRHLQTQSRAKHMLNTCKITCSTLAQKRAQHLVEQSKKCSNHFSQVFLDVVGADENASLFFLFLPLLKPLLKDPQKLQIPNSRTFMQLIAPSTLLSSCCGKVDTSITNDASKTSQKCVLKSGDNSLF